eukprot:gene15392-18595_t
MSKKPITTSIIFMSSKKFTRWIDKNNYKTCLRITQKYYITKEQGVKVKIFKKAFLILFTKRIFFILISLFRFNKNPYPKYFREKAPKKFLKRLLGLYKFQVENLLPEHPILKPIVFPIETVPLVSIIIAVHNHLDYTYNCLLSILNHTQGIKYEIIVVNDCSSDDTSIFMKEKAHNIVFLENTKNMGFLRSCNKASEVARGKYILFLNNDTQVRPAWLNHMLSVFQNDASTGLVGCKLIYPYGLLQEAGGLVNYLGEPANYGRFDDPNLSKYNYLRQTDYCSGAAVMLSKADFESIGRFDDDFAPAYYEDTDLCFSIRHKLNKKVYYQPLAEIVHFEGVSSGKTIKKGTVKEYQLINSKKFLDKWTLVFKTFPNTIQASSVADKFNYSQTLLFIDSCLPEYDKASGYTRVYELLKIFRDLKYNIIFLPHDRQKTHPYFEKLTNLGIRLIYPLFPFQNPLDELKEIVPNINIAWVSRPELNEIYSPFLKANRQIKWVYDTVDLHFIREERGLKLANNLKTDALEKVNQTKQKEVNLSKEADITIAITDVEREILEKNGARKVVMIPNIHSPYVGTDKTFNDRNGICFIGGYQHAPNVDAVLWLVKEIMPLVWHKYPDIKLTLLGSNPPESVQNLQSPKVIVPGYLKDVSEYFLDSRIFVAPLRYGAGMKGKIGQSLEFKLPLITTNIGAEGMNLKHNYNALIANTTEEFAQGIIHLYEDKNLWELISSNSFSAIREYSPEYVGDKLKELFL